jgi:hypothetical protein
MARRAEPLTSSVQDEIENRRGSANTVMNGRGGQDNAKSKTGRARDWSRRQIEISSGEAGGSRHGKAVVTAIADPKIDQKKQSAYLFA